MLSECHSCIAQKENTLPISSTIIDSTWKNLPSTTYRLLHLHMIAFTKHIDPLHIGLLPQLPPRFLLNFIRFFLHLLLFIMALPITIQNVDVATFSNIKHPMALEIHNLARILSAVNHGNAASFHLPVPLLPLLNENKNMLCNDLFPLSGLGSGSHHLTY